MEQLKIKGIYKGEFSDREHGACTGLHGTGAIGSHALFVLQYITYLHCLCCMTLNSCTIVLQYIIYLHCVCCNTLYICTVCVAIH